ncbi:DUF6894 family protein [Bradyrhizobium sp. CCBAU 45384]|uniref:DUF6894 family protein n=1 Tax=Bradyrhizobium sp. CCBAU 45384 TaxID=858428 RepID=UPI0023062E0B|nr:hypothetical protein [Bradyrhizobium sp. CCBAU 45384]
MDRDVQRARPLPGSLRICWTQSQGAPSTFITAVNAVNEFETIGNRRQALPQYAAIFFPIDNVAPTVDCEGEELPDDESARREATSYAGAPLNDIDGKFRPGEDRSLEVTDAARNPVFFINISSRKLRR